MSTTSGSALTLQRTFCRLPIGSVGPWSKVFVEQKNGEEEQGNWKKETSLLITPKFTMQSTENILALLSK
jgi:hypothetical protein